MTGQMSEALNLHCGRRNNIPVHIHIFCFNHSMDQHLINPGKESKTRDESNSLDHNMEFFFMVACVAALILVVVIQAFCIIKLSRGNSLPKKVKWYLKL